MSRPWWKRLLFGPTNREVIASVLQEPGVHEALRTNREAKRVLRHDRQKLSPSLVRELEGLEGRRG